MGASNERNAVGLDYLMLLRNGVGCQSLGWTVSGRALTL